MNRSAWKTLSFRCFDTVNTVIICTDDDSVCGKVAALCSHFQKLWNRFDPQSDIARISAHPGIFVPVDPETIAVFDLCEMYREKTGGSFHIGMGNFSQLWKPGEIWQEPCAELIGRSAEHLKRFEMKLTADRACVNPGITLDLGGIAKGYISDRIRGMLQKEEVYCGIINLGGNIVTFGDKPDGSDWEIGIRSPFHEDQICGRIRFRGNKALVTSGIYERCSSKDPEKYHHIIDPSTGTPVRNNLVSVSVFGTSGTECDVLATALMVKGIEEGAELLQRFSGVQAVFVCKDRTFVQVGNGNAKGELLIG